MGSTHPYYRRSKPKPQNEKDFVRDILLKQVVQRLRDQGTLPRDETISVKELNQRFQPVIPGSMRSLLLKMFESGAKPPDYINLANAHMEPYISDITLKQLVQRLRDYGVLPPGDTISVKELNQRFQPVIPGSMRSLLSKMRASVLVAEANSLFDKRAAAAVLRAANPSLLEANLNDALLEHKSYEGLLHFFIPRVRCLALMALGDYFPSLAANTLGGFSSGHVSQAILFARPGWCGTFGPGVAPFDLLGSFDTGDYDMPQMHLLQIAYRYYDELTPEAREHLITVLLAQGTIHRVGLDDTLTHGPMPNDWSRAGLIDELGQLWPSVPDIRIGETENHNLTILTARYLTNQLLYQRDHDPVHDNRRNSAAQHGPDCTGLLLTLLRDILRDDFSEYNAKPYQTQTRSALLNLCSYAYDHEVRLAARMVLDYISAHIAVSSSDLRRMVPFRRRNEGTNVTQLEGGVMDVGLLEWFLGADRMAEPFAIQAGNTRAYETVNERPVPPDNHKARPWAWAIATEGGEATMEALSDYRLPPSIHDLFVNDLHRRFFQRLHRVVQPDVELTGRNCDNMEIYAGSPSYLITAGGSPATYIFPLAALIGDVQQLGVAVTTSFMPTGLSAGPGTQNSARDLIQFSSFSDRLGEVANYGVAPDFACGHQVYLPGWVLANKESEDQFVFVHRGSSLPGKIEPAGFYLAIYSNGSLNENFNGNFTLLEAFDTWLHPAVTFEQFKERVQASNPNLRIQNNVEFQYTTQNGNRLRVVIWREVERDGAMYGARILGIEYGTGNPTIRDPMDSLGDAGNITDKFLNGTVMNSTADGVVEITNHFLGTKITLDMSDPLRPRRTSETGEVEEAGSNHEVWVDFAWTGPSEGDFFRPFNTIAAAAAAVADGGVIKIMPGSTRERHSIPNNKQIRLVAPIGGVAIGVR